MGFGDKVKSWFVIEEEGATSEKTGTSTAKPEVKTNAKSTASSAKNDSATAATSVGSGKVTSQFMDILLAAMEKNNLQGFDYFEFKESLKSLEAMPMDEATRFKSAFAMAKTMGATPEQLMKTAEHYVNVLQQEESKFGQALVAQRTKQIGGREDQIKQLQDGIHQKAEYIKKLTTEIEADQKTLSDMQKEISEAVVKVETTKNDFIASFNAITSMIQADINNMKKYLQ